MATSSVCAESTVAKCSSVNISSGSCQSAVEVDNVTGDGVDTTNASHHTQLTYTTDLRHKHTFHDR